MHASAEAELAPPAGAGQPAFATGGGYDGPLAYRQGKPMRPDVAQAFDRMAAAARADGVALVIASAFRSDAEQAVLFARHPDPKWVAPPGHVAAPQRHRARPRPAGGLRRGSPRTRRASTSSSATRWEPWHFGYALNPRSAPRAARHAPDRRRTASARARCPTSCRQRFAPAIARAAQRWSVSAALLAAQLYAESGFNPFARARRARRGSRSSCRAPRAAMGLDDPFDPDAAIDAQAHLMRDLLRQFASVPLALAAYNAGPAPVSALRLRARRSPRRAATSRGSSG